MVDFPEGGEGNGSRSGIGRRNIEGPQQVGVERIWEALGMGKSEGGELGIWISLRGGHQVFPTIDAEATEAAEKFLGCASDDFAESGVAFTCMVPRPSFPLLTYQRRWPGGLMAILEAVK